MDYYRDQLNRIHNGLSRQMRKTQEELLHLPEGYLRHHMQDGRNYYRQVILTDSGCSRTGINRNPELIAQLAKKDFLIKMQDAAEKDHKLLEQLMKRYQSLDPKDIMKQVSEACKSLPDQSFLQTGRKLVSTDPDVARKNRMKRHWEWANEEYRQSDYKPEEKIHLTTSGIYVRSKSEALITEKLYDYNVPNRYEEVIWIGGRDFAPDYKFRDAAGEPFYWEHAGMMGDPQYIRRHLFKMKEYERAGIVPWKNLIVTYDTVDGAVNVGLIDSIVRYQVLPKL